MRKDQVINLVNNHRRQKIGGDALQKVEGEYCGSTKDAFCRHLSVDSLLLFKNSSPSAF